MTRTACRRALRVLVALLFLLALLGCSGRALAAELTLHFIDIGQGDSVLIQSPSGQNVLYDGGDRGSAALDYLRSIGVERLDLVIASHHHADHIGGLIPVIAHYQPRLVMENGIAHPTRTYQDLLLAIAAAGSQLLEPTGQRIGLGEAALQVLPPPGIKDWGQDDNSVGVIIEYGNFRAGLTGDAKARLFQYWREHHSERIAAVHVYQASHHDSHDGDTPLSMSMFRPELVVIGVGAGNPYGHPREEALALYEAAGATVYRTDLHGTVIITATPEGLYRVTLERVTPQAPSVQTPAAGAPAPCINLNTASPGELTGILHIDEERSAQILDLRQERPFSSVKEMTRIQGVAQGRLRDILEEGRACVR